jgi:hypothetical protein
VPGGAVVGAVVGARVVGAWWWPGLRRWSCVVGGWVGIDDHARLLTESGGVGGTVVVGGCVVAVVAGSRVVLVAGGCGHCDLVAAVVVASERDEGDDRSPTRRSRRWR